MKPHIFWQVCLTSTRTRRRRSSCHRETTEATRDTWVDRSVADSRFRPAWCATKCPQDRKRRPPIDHLSRRRHIPQKYPRESVQTGQTLRHTASTHRRTSDQSRTVSGHPCSEAERTTTADWKSMEWAWVRTV